MCPSGFFSPMVSFTLCRTLTPCLVKSCTHCLNLFGRSSFFSTTQPSCPVSPIESCQCCGPAPNRHLPTSLSILHSLLLLADRDVHSRISSSRACTSPSSKPFRRGERRRCSGRVPPKTTAFCGTEMEYSTLLAQTFSTDMACRNSRAEGSRVRMTRTWRYVWMSEARRLRHTRALRRYDTDASGMPSSVSHVSPGRRYSKGNS